MMAAAFWMLLGFATALMLAAAMMAMLVRAGVKSASAPPAPGPPPPPAPAAANGYTLLDVRERLPQPHVPPNPGDFVKIVFRAEIANVTHVERMWVRVDARLGGAGVTTGTELDGEDPIYRGTLDSVPVCIPVASGDSVVFFLSNVLEVLPGAPPAMMH